IEALFMVIFNIFIDIFISLISIILITVVIFYINYKLAIATLFVVPFFIYMGYYFNYKTRKKQEKIHKKWDRFYGDLGDFITNLTLTKTLNYENKAKNQLNIIQDENLALQIPLSKAWSIADIYTHFMVNISKFIVLGIGIYLIINNEITFGVLFLFYSYIGYIYFPLSFIFSNIKNIQKNLESIKKMYEEFDDVELDVDLPNSLDIENVKGKIEFKNVSFSYNESKKVLEKINLSINPGEKIALVGSTGSGKSTITNLLLRFWDNYEGEILLDGKSIKNITKSSIRQHIGIVMQDNTLFNTTIRKNLELVGENITEKQIIKALKKAKADFVLDSKDGLETMIGERGLKLSGGEKQRLNIARIFLKNPEILILDEATSALDNKTEIEIQSSLDELLIGKTSIIIAHRLSTIKKVDKIFVMDNGKIIESGTYNELINNKSHFYNLSNPEKLIIN
ncbi:MAG: ABC transporter ATP-binding protein/permease, partial [Candidatus Gracilibacteria bacterium]|nr:ABC transporter ATP-binding protein/permease [Candidatus Gracilibacteria bacterium]